MRQNSFKDLIPARNATVHRRHRKEVFWQITFPMILGSLLLLGVCGFTIGLAAGGTGVEIWRDISLIWMLVPSLVFTLIPLVVLAGAAYGIIRLISALPGFFFKVQKFFTNVSERVLEVSNRLASPIVQVGSVWAGLRRLWK